MLLDKLRNENKYCTGCSACKNTCPIDAIDMIPDQEGFFIPHINSDKCLNCMLCERICPQLNLNKKNDEKPLCYAVKANRDILQSSTSGGAFLVLAQRVLEKNGYICGASLDEDCKGVSLQMVSTVEDVKRLQGSKYVYAKPGNIYQQIKEKLEDDAWVLFSSLPCQVAALQNYLQKDYHKLITVDLLCGGTPPQKLFHRYLDEVSKGKKVVDVKFRSKEFGWSVSCLEVQFEDGTRHIGPTSTDPYYRAYLNWLMVGNACGDCQYAPTPRVGDFTIGDFWNIARYFEEIDTSDGVSCVLINNQKAERVFEELSADFSTIKRVPLSFLQRFNRMAQKRPAHLARPRFFSLIDRGFSFSKAVDDSLDWKFDVGLTGCWSVLNYGGCLTYYALYHLLMDMQKTVIMIERRSNDPDTYNRPAKADFFLKHPYPFFDVSRVHRGLQDQAELNARVRNFIIGSDQIWNYRLFPEESINSYSLDYVKDYRKRIAYSSSFGTNVFNGTSEQKERFKNIIKQFDYVSVREDSAVDILEKEFDVQAVKVLDPVFLCNKKHYEELVRQSTIRVDGAYMFSYFIHPTRKKYGFEKIADKLNLGMINTITCDPVIKKSDWFSYKNWPYPYEEFCMVENWLSYIMNSAFILTDSFHAVCLSLIFNKPFIFIKEDMESDTGLDRVTSILEEVGLMSRMADSIQDIIESDMVFENIDYKRVNQLLEIKINESYSWLKNALESDVI